MDVGVGLWALRSTATEPANHVTLYRDLQDDARLAEDLGLHSVWLSEHHFWYDGWCPAPLVAAGAVLGATTRLHVGTGVMLLPLHDPTRVAAAGTALERMGPHRTHLGMGLGYRDAEYDGFGISRTRRGRLADAAFDHLAGAWRHQGPEILVGGISEASLRRAADRRLGLFLPTSISRTNLERAIDAVRERNDHARVGILKNAWVTDGTAAAEQAARAVIRSRAREYGGAWWLLGGSLGFAVPDMLEAQMERNTQSAFVGPPDAVAAELRELDGLGIDLVVLHIHGEETRPAHREAMERLAHDVLPNLA
jgi:alkanesulfonate monooxygenase SsuD/methylene tetrahydromethanopterin reductase-like flavin-dependent oxidoreductase (luciferase family)